MIGIRAKQLRMKLEAYNEFCSRLPATSHVVQWGGAHVWKVGGKVFAIGGWHMGAPEDTGQLFVTFKVSELAYDILKELPGCRPAPYLASRGMKWIQRTGDESVDDSGLCDYLRESHRIVASGLSQKRRRELGLD
jgi:predicted DNA-binding protein (MmcQ/YjbR family)